MLSNWVSCLHSPVSSIQSANHLFFLLPSLQPFQTNVLKILFSLSYSSVRTTSWCFIASCAVEHSRYSWLSSPSSWYSSMPIFINMYRDLCYTNLIFLFCTFWKFPLPLHRHPLINMLFLLTFSSSAWISKVYLITPVHFGFYVWIWLSKFMWELLSLALKYGLPCLVIYPLFSWVLSPKAISCAIRSRTICSSTFVNSTVFSDFIEFDN